MPVQQPESSTTARSGSVSTEGSVFSMELPLPTAVDGISARYSAAKRKRAPSAEVLQEPGVEQAVQKQQGAAQASENLVLYLKIAQLEKQACLDTRSVGSVLHDDASSEQVAEQQPDKQQQDALHTRVADVWLHSLQNEMDLSALKQQAYALLTFRDVQLLQKLRKSVWEQHLQQQEGHAGQRTQAAAMPAQQADRHPQ